MSNGTRRRRPISAADESLQLPVQRTAARAHQVSIYVTDHCANCDYAWEVANLIRGEYPHVTVAIIDLANPQEPVPDAVFATPTYLLDGHLWSLGNPSPQQVHDKLGRLED
jgi:hypothetical protein